MIVAFLLYLVIEGKFATTIHSERYESEELCLRALGKIRQSLPIVKGGVCVQQEVDLR